jgi:formylglycine-generating enzyme required for sulfatase activity
MAAVIVAALRHSRSRVAPRIAVFVPAGEFTMGTDDPRSMTNERPAHRVRLDGFWMDAHPVTNAEFRAFVAATGFVTTAERPVDWEELRKQVAPGTPRPDDSMLAPGALVFTPTSAEVPLEDVTRWWRWASGASWRHPEGPETTLAGKDDHPVVQVSWDDASAYCAWAGGRLPTEAEWEYASRGGLEGTRFAWGDDERPGGRHMANTYQGAFPARNTAEDGFTTTSPVGAFPPNRYGLYDMAGNVWNWCSDWYRSDAHALAARGGIVTNPPGPSESFSPDDAYASRRVMKGGSFLCHVSYCESYRPTARRGTPPDTGSSHVGFRCARSK